MCVCGGVYECVCVEVCMNVCVCGGVNAMHSFSTVIKLFRASAEVRKLWTCWENLQLLSENV